MPGLIMGEVYILEEWDARAYTFIEEWDAMAYYG